MAIAPAIVSSIRAWAEQAHSISKVWLFGSRVRGDHGPDSDLDVAIDLDVEDASDRLGVWMDNAETWRAELRALVPFKVDLQAYEIAGDDKTVGPAVRAEGLLVFESGPRSGR